MKRWHGIALLFGLVIPVVACLPAGCGSAGSSAVQAPADGSEPPIDVPEADLKELVAGNNQFAIELFKKIAETEKGNILISPYSISSALAMVYAGARGETAEEMKRVLHFTLPPDRLHKAFAGLTALMQTAGKNRPYQLNIANALWVQKGLQLLPSYLTLTKSSYGAGVREVDITQTDSTKKIIDEWISERTHGNIVGIPHNNSIDTASRLILTNAIYIQGEWEESFDSAMTRMENFELKLDEFVKVPMMTKKNAKARTAYCSGIQMLEIPYSGNSISAIFIMPNRAGDLNEFISQLTLIRINDAINQLEPLEKTLHLPKTILRNSFALELSLRKLGMSSCFDKYRANFTGITISDKLFVSNVSHNALIDINEKGTTAASTTSIYMNFLSSNSFAINRPYLFMLYDRVTKSIVLISYVNDPRVSASQ